MLLRGFCEDLDNVVVYDTRERVLVRSHQKMLIKWGSNAHTLVRAEELHLRQESHC